jgi:hypothetical protein
MLKIIIMRMNGPSVGTDQWIMSGNFISTQSCNNRNGWNYLKVWRTWPTACHQVETKSIYSLYYSRTMIHPRLQHHARLSASVPRASARKTKIIQHVSPSDRLAEAAASSKRISYEPERFCESSIDGSALNIGDSGMFSHGRKRLFFSSRAAKIALSESWM